MGPGAKPKLTSRGLKTALPVMSAGSKSGVSWMRLKLHPTLRASVRASIVLPVPGTSSMSKCPRAAQGNDCEVNGCPLTYNNAFDVLYHTTQEGIRIAKACACMVISIFHTV
jgi:hypothetical protein